MKALELNQMERIEGGDACSKTAKARAWIGGIATIGSAFGPIGLAIFGPTALGIAVASAACAYK